MTDWRQLLEALVENGPWMDRDYGNCLCCNMPDYDTSHDPGCPWRVAVNALAAENAASPSSPK